MLEAFHLIDYQKVVLAGDLNGRVRSKVENRVVGPYKSGEIH
jgi:hypothetical protein